MNQYETVFILTPVLSDVQMKEAVEKFKGILQAEGAEIINEENWGLKKLAYPIQKKSTGFYQLIEFNADPTVIDKLEINFQLVNYSRICIELNQLIKTCRLFLNWISQFLQSPVFFIDNLSTFSLKNTFEFLYRFLHLNIR